MRLVEPTTKVGQQNLTVVGRTPVSRLVNATQAVTTARRGEVVYGAYCVACHGQAGEGSHLTTVPLAQVARDLDDNALATFIGEGVPGSAMPPFQKTLTAEQITDVTAFIRSWQAEPGSR